MSKESSQSRKPSVVERLSLAVGAPVDPEVALEGEGPSGASASSESTSGKSSGVVGRLRSRPALSSRYRLEGEIARGGMGAILEVWDEDLRRRLAMKVALAKGEGARVSNAAEDLDPRLLSRFLEEAQVTGQLEHPGIVPVHELGIDDNGVVFFTMQLVQGRDLDKVFRLVPDGAEGWSVTRALGVLMKVCEAMAFAHSKGVVHRDLKPANVMVGNFGEVYVMDWGLVRIQGRADRHDLRVTSNEGVETDQRTDAGGGESDALYTMDGDVLGTPAYMSPEQARGEIEHLDARSDVYSLGAMLYHLLSGVAPYDRKGAPSLRAHETLSALYAGPPPSLAGLASDAPAELVAIAEKAMEREAADRYPDMHGLAEDLRAYLENRVVQAYQTGAVAEARKWVRRNRPLAASLAGGLLALVGGLVASLILKAQSDENATRASRQGSIAREVANFMNDDLLAAIRPDQEGIDVTVREVLGIASSRLDGRFESEPMVEAELRETIGTSFHALGEFETALGHLERANELWVRERGANSESALSTALQVSGALSDLGRFDEALEWSTSALAQSEVELGEHATVSLEARTLIASITALRGEPERAAELFVELEGDMRRHLGSRDAHTLDMLTDYADALRTLGRLAEAEKLQVETLEALRETRGDGDPGTLAAGDSLGETYVAQGRSAEAEELLIATQEIRERVLGPDHPATANGLGRLGIHYYTQGRIADAEKLFTRGLEMLRRSVGSEHPFTLLMANNLAAAWSGLGRYDEALALRKTTLEAQRRRFGVEHPDTILSIGNLAILLRSLSRYEEAEAAHLEEIELREKVLGGDHPDYWAALENLSGLRLAQGRFVESIELSERVLEGRKRTLGPEHPAVARTCFNLGVVSSSINDLDSARAWYEEAVALGRRSDAPDVVTNAQAALAELAFGEGDLEIAKLTYLEAVSDRRAFGIEDLNCADWLLGAGRCAHELQDYDEAAAIFEDALALLRDLVGSDDEAAIGAMLWLARSLHSAERFEAAEELAFELHDILVTKEGTGSERVGQVRTLIVEMYEDWGRPEEAALWRE